MPTHPTWSVASSILVDWVGRVANTDTLYSLIINKNARDIGFSPCWLGYYCRLRLPFVKKQEHTLFNDLRRKNTSGAKSLKSLLVSLYDFRIGYDLPSTLSQRKRGKSHPKMKLEGKPRLLGPAILISHYGFGMGWDPSYHTRAFKPYMVF